MDKVESQDFFSGLSAMRQYWERHTQDPNQRQARLFQIAKALVKPRRASELAQWLSHEFADAFGAHACVLLLRDIDWHPWFQVGTPKHDLSQLRSDIKQTLLKQETWNVHLQDKNLMLPINGVEKNIGAFWLENIDQMAPRNTAFLQAIADTAGVALEQGLGVEALIQDPITGLLSEGAFIEALECKTSITHAVPGILMVMRIVSMETIREAYGFKVAQSAFVHLTQVVKSTLPATTIVGVRFTDILIYLSDVVDNDNTDKLIGWAKDIFSQLNPKDKKDWVEIGAACVYTFLNTPQQLHWSVVIDQLRQRVGNLSRGKIKQINLP